MQKLGKGRNVKKCKNCEKNVKFWGNCKNSENMKKIKNKIKRLGKMAPSVERRPLEMKDTYLNTFPHKYSSYRICMVMRVSPKPWELLLDS